MLRRLRRLRWPAPIGRSRAAAGSRRRGGPGRLLAIVLAGACCLAWTPEGPGERAVELLSRLREASPSPVVGVVQRDLILPGGAPVAAKLYVPAGPSRRAMVLVHGIHRRSIRDPRVIRVSTELASQGVTVLTPEMSDLADYRITEESVETIARAVKALSRMTDAAPSGKVGLVGISFGGGLALVAAARPDVGEHLEYVSSIGAHHDFQRVLRFFLTNVAEAPEGGRSLQAHEYGLTVLVYGRLPALAPAADLETLRSAFRAWLAEDRPLAREHAARLTTPRGRMIFAHLDAGRLGALRSELEADLTRDAARLSRLSPAGKLRGVPAPIYLLHGKDDHLIPTAELQWAVRELGDHPHQAVVTSLIDHVMPDKPASILEVMRLADVLSHWL